MLPFERRFEILQRPEEMLVDVTFPGEVFPVLKALGADDSLRHRNQPSDSKSMPGTQLVDGNVVEDRSWGTVRGVGGVGRDENRCGSSKANGSEVDWMMGRKPGTLIAWHGICGNRSLDNRSIALSLGDER